MQQQSIEYHQKSSLHRPWPCSWSNQVSQAHPGSYIPNKNVATKCSCSDFQISDIFLALFTIDLLFSCFHRFIVFSRYKDEGLKDRKMSIAGGRWFEETKSAACSHTRSVLQSRECFPAGNNDEVAACRTLRTLYCATVNLSSLSYFDIFRSHPDRKGASFGNHRLQPRFVTYEGTIRALHICHSAQKKRRKKPRNATPRRREL
jgi:hypothetical protein